MTPRLIVTALVALLALTPAAPFVPVAVPTMTEYTTSPQLVAPAAADGVSVTPNASANTFSGWVEITASTASAWILTGVSVLPGATDLVDTGYVVQVGTGGSGSETAIAELQGNSSQAPNQQWIPAGVPVDNIGAGARVAVRLKKRTTNTTAWTIAVMYYAKPTTGTITATTALSTGFIRNDMTPSGSSWGNSGFSQLIASTSSAIALSGHVENPLFTFSNRCNNGAVVELEIDFATGAAASESVVTTDRFELMGAAMSPLFEIRPLLQIPTATRVSARFRKSGTVTFGHCATEIEYYSSLGAIALANLTTTQATTWTPSAADGTTITSGNSDMANGSWTQMIASTATDVALTGLSLRAVAGSTDYELEIGVGGSGSESAIGVVRFTVGSLGGGMTKIPIEPAINVGSGQRVAVRSRAFKHAGTYPRSLTLGLATIASPTFAQRLDYADGPYGAWPAAAANVSVTPNASAWANSSFVELVASASADSLIRAITYTFSQIANQDAEFDLATGAAASESVITTFRVAERAGANVGAVAYLRLPVPQLITAGSRVSVRMRKAGTNTTAWTFAVHYLAKPSNFPFVNAAFPGLFISGLRPGAIR